MLMEFRIYSLDLSPPHPDSCFAVEFIKYIEFVHLFGDVACEEVDIVLSDVKTWVTEEFWERDDIAAV